MPSVSASSASASRISPMMRSRSATDAALRVAGALSGSDRRMRSIAFRAIAGRTSHDGEMRSYSLEARAP